MKLECKIKQVSKKTFIAQTLNLEPSENLFITFKKSDVNLKDIDFSCDTEQQKQFVDFFFKVFKGVKIGKCI